MTVMNSRVEGPADIAKIFYWFPVFLLLCVATQFLWQWSVAVKLRMYIRAEARLPRVRLFRITFFLPLVLFCLMPILFVDFFSSFEDWQPNSVKHTLPMNPGKFVGLIMLMFFGYMVLLFCMLNNLYVVSKTIKMAELQRKVVFSDFAGDFFFMLFIFPVAIWFIQPRINAVVLSDLKRAGLGNEDLLD